MVLKPLSRLDRFPTQVKLKFNGNSSLPTYPGLLVSLLTFLILIVYGQQKFTKWLRQKQPMINTYDAVNHFDSKHEVDLNQLGFKLAFGVVDYRTGSPLQDESFVRFNVFLEERKDLAIVG